MTQSSTKLNIEGMTCNSCVRHVTSALQALPGVASVDVSRSERRASVTYDSERVAVSELIDAVQEAGYEASLS